MKTVIYQDVPGRGLEAFCVLDLSEALRYQVEDGPTLHVSVPGRPVVYLRFHRLEFLPDRSVLIGVTDPEGAIELGWWFRPACTEPSGYAGAANFYMALTRVTRLAARVSGV